MALRTGVPGLIMCLFFYYYYFYFFKSCLWILSKYVAISLMSGVAGYTFVIQERSCLHLWYAEVLTDTKGPKHLSGLIKELKQLYLRLGELGVGCWQPTQNEATEIHPVLSRLLVSEDFPSRIKPQTLPQLIFPWQPQHRETGAWSRNLLANSRHYSP